MVNYHNQDIQVIRSDIHIFQTNSGLGPYSLVAEYYKSKQNNKDNTFKIKLSFNTNKSTKKNYEKPTGQLMNLEIFPESFSS